MRVVIDDKVIEKHGLSVNEFLLLLSTINMPTDEEATSLTEEKFLVSFHPIKHKYFITQKGRQLVIDILNDNQGIEEKKSIDSLASKMQELYPKGKKAGTNYYWRGNLPEIKQKLSVFFKRYGEYPEEIVLKATENFIASFKEEYRFMPLLKYFIWKNQDEDKKSDLLTWIENIDEEDTGYDTSYIV